MGTTFNMVMIGPVTTDADVVIMVEQIIDADFVEADPVGSADKVQSNLDAHIANAITHITSAERTKWNSKAEGDHTHTVDSALSSSSTNPVQNKVVYSALGNIETALDNIIALQESLIGGDSV